MNTTPILDNLDSVKQARQPVQEDQTQKIVEAVRGCLQMSLAGEAQNFRSWVAASHRKFKDMQQMALMTTALAILVSLVILLTSIWQARRISHQAEAQVQNTSSTDVFADLRRQNLAPTGPIISQKGRTFIELKTGK